MEETMYCVLNLYLGTGFRTLYSHVLRRWQMHTLVNSFFPADKFLSNEAEIITLDTNLTNKIIALYTEYDIRSEEIRKILVAA